MFLGAAVVLCTALATVSPASAREDVAATPKTSGSVAGAPPAGAVGGDASINALVSRINQLVAAYDHDAHRFDLAAVPSEVLNSDEGQAFLAVVSLGEAGASPAELSEAFAELRDGLRETNAPSSVEIDRNGVVSTYELAPGMTIVFPTALAAGSAVRGLMRATVVGGADPWPYIQLTNAEQQAMVTGASGALVAAICALLAPTTAGVGCGVGAAVIAMIVGIIVANGVCPYNRQMRIYPLVGPTGFSCQR